MAAVTLVRPSQRRSAVDLRRAERAEAARERIADRRRFQAAPPPEGEAVGLAPDNPALAEGRTTHRHMVLDPARELQPVLKDGAMNAKIGGDVLVGRLKGARILTLTLEERATCPATCGFWAACYGNRMQWARRWAAGPALEARLREELATLRAAGRRVLVRLHVLGDFYSRDYVRLWFEALKADPGLHVFGFTAWGPKTEIGEAVAVVRRAMPERFAIRQSGRTGRWGSFTLDFPTARARIGDAVVCPEQRDAMNGTGRLKHCGSCAVCWQTDLPVAFVEH